MTDTIAGPTTAAQAPDVPDLYDVASEQVVLGAMMLNSQTAADVAGMLSVADFFRPPHAAIFTAIVDLNRETAPTDAVAVAARLTDRGQLSRVGGPVYLHTLIELVPTAANGTYHARIVADRAVLRRLVAAGTRIVQLAQSCAHGQAATALDTARTLLAELDAPATDDGPVAWREILPTVLQAIDDDGQADSPVGVTPTGFVDLDKLLNGGNRPGQLVVLAARPGMGKSTLAVDFARHLAFNQRGPRQPVGVWTLEMSQDEIARRIISAQSGVPLAAITTGQLDGNDWSRVIRVAAATEDAPLFVDDSPTLTVADIRSRALKLKRRHGLSAMVVDYMQLMTPGKGSGRESRQEQVAQMYRALKLMGKELGVVVYAVSQLNRGPEGRADKRPSLGDLRESGAAEQDADVVIFVHRDDYYDKESPRSGEADFIVAKNRNGPTDTVTVAAQLHLSRFVDMALPE